MGFLGKTVQRFAVILLLIHSVYIHTAYAQQTENTGITLKGRVYNAADRKPVDFASVIILEAKIKTRSNAKGDYTISIPSPGEYTLIIRAAGLKLYKIKIKITRSGTRDFWIQPMRITSGVLTIVGERDIQKVSRYTLTVKDLKDVPASLGDALNALTSLPGVIKTGGFFGNLVIRGASPDSNRYYVDNIPLYNPQHFGGLHSVIANELISEIDLYASAFPAQFGGPTAAVINMNTVDDVKEFGGWVDLGLISAAALLKFPITKKVLKDENFVDEVKGYVMVSGRYGYLALFIPWFYELILGEDLGVVPEYWDYQVKAKYFFNSKHALTLLAFGSSDYFRVVSEEGGAFSSFIDDPVLKEFNIRNEIMTFTQGLTYTYEPSKRFKNELLFYASLTESYTYSNIDSDQIASWAREYENRCKPYIYGFKDTLKFNWLKNNAELRIGADITFYDFIFKGNSYIRNDYQEGIPDFSNPNAFYLAYFDDTTLNITIGGYIENKFTYKGLIVTLGVHLNYLERSGHVIADPRLLISYDFETKTTLSLAGGLYSSFYQVNPYLFTSEQYITKIGSGLSPERAAHGTLGLEQKVYLFTIKAEGFFNYFWDVAVQDYNVDNYFDNSAEIMAYGAELLVRLDRNENTAGFFGWINYTYTQSKYKSGLPASIEEPYNDTYVNYEYEQEHALKLILGYSFKKHTISGKFQLYTSFPYTPITGGYESPAGSGRYFPSRLGVEPNSEHFPIRHQLDVRYTYTSTHNWGQVSWYIEIINIYNQVPVSREIWDYNRPYERGVNPTFESDDIQIGIIPNFGVEIKF